MRAIERKDNLNPVILILLSFVFFNSKQRYQQLFNKQGISWWRFEKLRLFCLLMCYNSAMNGTDFFTLTTERSTVRTVSLLASSIVLCFFPTFLYLVIRYEKTLQKRTILNYLATDFCVVFAFAFVVVQTIETVRFAFGPCRWMFATLKQY